jgi:hypothetical protein
MLSSFAKYFTVVLAMLVCIKQALMIIRLLFNPAFLKHKFFEFPTKKSHLIAYCLVAILANIIWIALLLNLI